jgi:hypothetical protein
MLTPMSTGMIIQGRQLFADDIELIRHLMAEHPDWHRSRLSLELCRMWNWRTDKGLLKDMACRSMLRKLEQRQLIVLPQPRCSGNRARRIRDIAHSCDPIDSPLEHLRPLEIVMVAARGDADHLFHCLMDRYHYLGCRGHVGEHIKYMVYDCRKRPLACLLFGSAAWKTAVRDRFIGWSTSTRQANLKLMTNNMRFLILPWVKVANLASFILGACLRRLRDDWQQRYGHDLCLVETFVDRSRFAGTCYQAANWVRIGKTKGRSRQDRHKRLKVAVKDLYLYPLTVDFKQRLCAVN